MFTVTVLTVIHVVLTVSLIGLVLVQRGKGADVGAAFGSGASNTMFGSQGAASFLTRATALVATLFFVTSLSLAFMGGQRMERKSVTDIESVLAPAVIEQTDVPAMPGDLPDLPPEQ